MAKGSVRKKGKKWYYRFYVEDYESKKFIAKADNITLRELLNIWAEEELKVGTLSNGTVSTYLQAINRIKQHPVSRRELKTVTSGYLQQSFRFAVFPKQYITFNSMQYVVMRHKKDDMDLFAEETDTKTGKVKPLSFEQYQNWLYSLASGAKIQFCLYR